MLISSLIHNYFMENGPENYWQWCIKTITMDDKFPGLFYKTLDRFKRVYVEHRGVCCKQMAKIIKKWDIY